MNTLAVLYRQWSLGFPSSPVCFRGPSCFISLVALSIEPGREYRALSDTYWSVVGLGSTVTIRAVPETAVEIDPLVMLMNLMKHTPVL